MGVQTVTNTAYTSTDGSNNADAYGLAWFDFVAPGLG